MVKVNCQFEKERISNLKLNVVFGSVPVRLLLILKLFWSKKKKRKKKNEEEKNEAKITGKENKNKQLNRKKAKVFLWMATAEQRLTINWWKIEEKKKKKKKKGGEIKERDRTKDEK